MAVVCQCIGILTVDVVDFFRNPGVFHSQDSFPSKFRRCVCCRELRASAVNTPIATTPEDVSHSQGRNPENGKRRDFRRRRYRQSGFQHTDRPWPSSPELFNKDLQNNSIFFHGSLTLNKADSQWPASNHLTQRKISDESDSVWPPNEAN